MIHKRVMAVILTVFMVFTTMPFGMVANVFAAEPIGSITVDGKTNTYTEYKPLKQALEKLSNKVITVEMLCDWDETRAPNVKVGERLKIPAGSTTTFNMNGHILNRNMTRNNDTKSDGELFRVYDGATLIINGGSGTRTEDVYLYTSFNNSAKPQLEKIDFTGGLLTGGASFDGAGGIHASKNTNITLNNVTLAGMRATKKGYGAGMFLEGANTKVILNSSTITGCYAQNDGGAIYGEDEPNISIELNKRSSILKNYAGSDGGGINLDGPNASVIGTNFATINENESNGRGGGILMFGEGATVKNFNIVGNKAKHGGGIYINASGSLLNNLGIFENEASEGGGGVYYNNDDMWDQLGKVVNASSIKKEEYSFLTGHTMKGCEVRNNKAKSGGGVRMQGGDSVSLAKTTLYYYQDLNLKGNIQILNNASDNEHKNLYAAAGNANYTRIGTDLSASSEVHISYYDNDASEVITLTPPNKKDTDSTAHLYSDQSGWYFDYSDGRTRRIRGHKPNNKPDLDKVDWDKANDPYSRSSSNAVAGKVGTVGAGGVDGSGYDKIRFFSNHESHDYISTVFYSDGLFYGDPDKYNSHLATTSWAMAYAAGYINKDEDGKEANGNKYYNKHATARQFMADIGCPDQNIYVNDHNVNMPWTDTIGVAIGSKELKKADGTKTGDVLVPITVRGLQYELEWLSNVTLGHAGETTALGKEAMGFSAAASQVMAEIDYYLDKYGLRDKFRKGEVKFWITGYSRAGATANITAKRLLEKIEVECPGHRSQVFAYTCEAPKGGTDDAEKLGDKTKYYGIHNMVNTTDLVPYVGPTEMGFKRYGIDHYFPEGAYVDSGVKKTVKTVKRGGTGGVTTVTTYADNYPHTTKGGSPDDAATKSYDLKRGDMMKHLSMIDSSMAFDDYFHPMTLDFVDIDWLSFDYNIMQQYEYGDYWGNAMEDFVADFIRFAQEGKEPDQVGHWSQAIASRDVYAKDPLKMDGKEYPTVQSTAQDLMLMIMLMPKDQTENFVKRVGKIMDEFDMINWSGGSMLDLYTTLVGEYHDRTDETKKEYADLIYKKLKDTGALDNVSPEGKALLEKNWITVYDVLLKLLDADFNYKPKNNRVEKGQPEWATGSNGTMMYIPTFLTYIEQILSNHLPQVNMAWARSEDDWYDKEEYEYTLNLPTNVDIPKAFATQTPLSAISDKSSQSEDPKELEEGESEKNTIAGDQRIILENEDIVGEAVYYDLIDVTDNNKILTKNQIYRGGVNLTIGNATKKEYRIVTYDMSYGVKSEKAIYSITLTGTNHNVIIRDKDDSGKGRTQNLTLAEDQKAPIMAGNPQDYYFKNWSVNLLDDEGNDLGDVTEELLGSGDESKADKPAISFAMPKVGGDYPAGYQLEFTAEYGDRITALEVDSVDPVAGQPLAEWFKLTFNVNDDQDNPISREYPVIWTYKDGDTTFGQASGTNAYNETEYIAIIHVPQEQAEDIMFATEVEASIASNPHSEGEIVASPVKRNNADGSVTVQISFAPTDESGDQDKPSTDQTFKVVAIDLNINEPDADTDPINYYSHPEETMTITAPDVPGERFEKWDLSNSKIELVDGSSDKDRTITIKTPGTMPDNAEIYATYIPVVKTVDVNLYDKDGNIFTPVGGGGKPDRVEMFVKISNEYEVHPDNLELTWSPELAEDGKFAYLTSYTATVSIKPGPDGKIKVRDNPGEDFYERGLLVIPADDLTATFNNSTDQVSFIVDDKSVSKVFPPTRYILKSVKNPDDISNVEHGKTEAEILEMLPGTTTILTENDLEFDAAIEWTSLTPGDQADPREACVWTATGKVTLPYTVENRNNVLTDVSMKVSVLEAATALKPTATLDSGKYLYNQVTEIETHEPDGTTYYTTDGSDPADSGTRKEYNVEQIIIDRDSSDLQDELDNQGEPTGRKVFVLKAYTVKEGKWDSDVSMYRYVFDDLVPVPEGKTNTYTGKPQIGVEAGVFYTLEPLDEGVEIDENGNAAATNAGTYKVKAKLSENDCKWITDEYVASQDTKADRNKTYYKKNEGEEEGYTAVSPTEYLEPAGDEEDAKPTPANPAEKGWFEKATTKEDRVISFTIEPADIAEVAEVRAKGKFKSVEDLMKAFGVHPKDDWDLELKEDRDYDVSFGRIKDGKVTVTVRGKGNYTGTITSTFIIEKDGGNKPADDPDPGDKDNPDKDKYVITYDLNGGELNGFKGIINEEYFGGETIKLPKPLREGYVFDYWKGSKYKAGQKYKVTEDHTFTAMWKKDPNSEIDYRDPDNGDGSDSSRRGARTGDSSSILGWLAIFMTSVLAALFAAILRRRQKE